MGRLGPDGDDPYEIVLCGIIIVGIIIHAVHVVIIFIVKYVVAGKFLIVLGYAVHFKTNLYGIKLSGIAGDSMTLNRMQIENSE